MSFTSEELDNHAREIATKIGETDFGPTRQVKMIIQHAGLEFAQRMLEETMEIETSGGLLTSDGTRRRTLGGVYFYVVKGKLEPSLRQIIFPGYGQTVKGAVIEWEDRMSLVQPLLESRQFGVLTATPRLTIYGKPKEIQQNENSIVMILESALEPISYPRGIPTPPSDPTLYTVYLGKTQWERVDRILKKNPNDSIIVEGTCMWDRESGTVAVFALIVNSKWAEKTNRKQMMNPAVSGADDETGAVLPARPNIMPNPKKQGANASKPKPNNKPPRVANSPEPTASTPTNQDVPESVTKLAQLEQAAVTLRERIASMESKNQPGVAMTKKLLENTERQIEALRRSQ